MGFPAKLMICPLLLAGFTLCAEGAGPQWQELLQAAEAHAAAKDYEPALGLAREALAEARAKVGRVHPDVAQTLECMARIQGKRTFYVLAAAEYERALRIRSHFGEENPVALALVRVNLGRVYQRLKRPGLAWALFNDALRIWERYLGLEHPDLVHVLNDLASVRVDGGHFRQAEPYLARVVAILEKAHGANHPSVARALQAQGANDRRERDYAKAEPVFERALNILEAAFGPNDLGVAKALQTLARNARDLGHLRRAEELMERVLAIRVAALGPNAPAVAEALKAQAKILRAGHQGEKALLLEQRAAAIRRRSAARPRRLTTIQEEAPDLEEAPMQAEPPPGR